MDFSASGRLERCAERREFGHNFALEVTLSGEPDPETGMVMDLKRLKEIMAREVEARFDHRNLNDDTPFFSDRPPTPENLAQVIFGLLDAALPEGMLHGVKLWPTDDLGVEVAR